MKNLMMIILLATMSIFAFGQKQGNTQGKPRPNNSPEERALHAAENLSKQLLLNDMQKKQVHDLVLDKVTKIKSIREKNPTDRKAAQAEMQPIRKDFEAQMKKILNNEQYTKWQQIKAARKAKMDEQRKAHQQQNNQVPAEPEGIEGLE